MGGIENIITSPLAMSLDSKFSYNKDKYSDKQWLFAIIFSSIAIEFKSNVISTEKWHQPQPTINKQWKHSVTRVDENGIPISL